jgi:rod shape determining protein RodA
MSGFFERFRYFDIPLLIVSGLLLIVGLVIIYSTSVSAGTLGVFYRQAAFAGIGVAGFFAFSLYNYHKLAKQNRLVYVVLVLLLVSLLLFARSVRGSVRWFDLGFFNFQPAEFAKMVVVLGLSRWLYLKRGQINSWKSIAATLFYVLIPAGLIVLEPDLGSAIIVMSIWLGMLLVSSMKKKYVLAFILVALLAVGVAWKFVLKDYQKTRVEVFVNPNLDPRGRGYNVRQAVIAVGSGALSGRGLGRGLQSQLKFLPERQTDFIFASAAEEVGFIGCVALLVLYYILLWRLVKIMRYAKDDLGYYIAGGVVFLFFAQILINIGMNMGLLPVTGIPLPFLTYGGSSLVVVFIALGVVQNVARQSRILRF